MIKETKYLLAQSDSSSHMNKIHLIDLLTKGAQGNPKTLTIVKAIDFSPRNSGKPLLLKTTLI